MKIVIILLLCSTYSFAQYLGTGSVTQGLATATSGNLYSCTNGRIAALGTITATDNTVWTVPAVTNFTNNSFPFASNLYNECTGNLYANSTSALAALNGSGDAPTGLYSLITTNIDTTATNLTHDIAVNLEGLVDAADGTNVKRGYFSGCFSLIRRKHYH